MTENLQTNTSLISEKTKQGVGVTERMLRYTCQLPPDVQAHSQTDLLPATLFVLGAYVEPPKVLSKHTLGRAGRQMAQHLEQTVEIFLNLKFRRG